MATETKKPKSAKPTLKERLTAWAGRQAERAEVVAKSYHDLVRVTADEEPIDDDRAVAILADAGKTVDQLAKDVEVLKQRRAWRANFDREPEIAKELKAAEDTLAQLQSERATFDAEWKRRADPIAARRPTLLAEYGQRPLWRQKLIDTAPVHLKGARAKLDRQLRELGGSIGQRKRIIEKELASIKWNEQRMSNTQSGKKPDAERRTAIAHHRAEIKRLQGEIGELQTRLDAVQKSIEACIEEMLKP